MAHYKGDANETTRAMHIMRKRERAKEELEEKRKKIEGDVKVSTIDNKFATQTESVESQLRSSTVGLVTLTQMREKQEIAVKEREKQLAQREIDDSISIHRDSAKEKIAKTSVQKKSLSFYDEEEEEEGDDNEDDEDEPKNELMKLDHAKNADSQEQECDDKCDIKNQPTVVDEDDNGSNLSASSSMKRKRAKFAWDKLDVDTSLLPDREREEEERRLREKLATEWRERQQKLKEEEIVITFSYWDGSGHRRLVRMKKGDTIYQFLQACLETLRKDFNELRSVSADQLVYVKEDLIIPHHYTFYDFIVTKARGKSGPLFAFDVHEDVRLVANASVEKDESHAGKVLLRSWYERNKHIFPASRWEPYDPTRSYDKYTISDKRSK